MQTRLFDLLTPQVAVQALEQSYSLTLDGTVSPYPSYINRVYGVRTDDGEELIAKFYRPGRWRWEALLEEHRFIEDCARGDVPVVAPIADSDGDTLQELEVETTGNPGDNPGDDPADTRTRCETFAFALFPKRGGRNFDAESDEQWFRLGALAGRCHLAGGTRTAPNRPVLAPSTAAGYVAELIEDGVVHPDCREEFEELCGTTIETFVPMFDGVRYQRVHGDCHRGNILERPGEGLLLIDFDDTMSAPPVQDIWLLLPDHAENCRRELTMLLEGYEQFLPFDHATTALIEPLRFMRIIYFLTWQARQRHDYWFQNAHPDWGSKAFWITEREDLRSQAGAVG